MSIPAAALGVALLLSQVEGGERTADPPAAEQPAEEQSWQPVSPPRFPLDPDAPLPSLRSDEPVLCARFSPSEQVPSGAFRMQCPKGSGECLVSPAHELDSSGVETQRRLERVEPCSAFVEGASYAALGRTFRAAVADAPPGWYRDELGRLMQYNFDLHRRVWLGAGWAPIWNEYGEGEFERLRMDFGIRTEFPSARERHLHRFSFLETELLLGPQRGLDVALLHYDFSSDRDRPILRVTTFLGKPRRLDLQADMGAWFEVLRLEQLHRDGADYSFLTLATAHATLDLWHSRDLVSFVRVRAGPSLEQDRTNGFSTVVPGAVLEGDFTLDADGFHHLRLGVEAEKVLFDQEVDGRPRHPERLLVRAGVETILLALNDQPLSLVLDGRGMWRSDLAGVPAEWEWTAQAGLRFSLWAPARRSATLAARR
ncbi:hypothetical protein P2318_25770 [Myxococcaceae bacterium GXIMD 01537]